VSGLLFSAFKALGPGASRREIAQVAAALHESGDEEAGRLLNCAIWTDGHNPDLWDRCVEIAEEAGAGPFVALDLVMAFSNPEGFARLVRTESAEVAN
jgi:hypothetical protein